MILDNQQRTFLAIGSSLLGLGITSIFYYWGQTLHYKKKSQKLQKIEKERGQQLIRIFKNPGEFCDFSITHKCDWKGEEQLKIRNRQIPNLYECETDLIEHISGGDMKINISSKLDWVVKFQDATVFKSSLKRQKQQLSKFKNVDKIAASVTYTLVGNMYLGMVGRLCYDLDSNAFLFYPQYIGSSIGQIYNYFKGQEQLNKMMMIFSGAILVTIGAVFAFPPIKKVMIRLYDKIWREEILHQNFYKNSVTYSADPQDHLTCMVCKKNSVEVSYQCGHLSSCLSCHQKKEGNAEGEGFKCPLCNQVFQTYEKFYFA